MSSVTVSQPSSVVQSDVSFKISGQKRSNHASGDPPPKRSCSTSNNQAVTETNKLPPCLKKLVRSIVRTFYSREHSLIVDMLVRNTIMNEDDLCERLRFEKKQLRQYLHTLKTDQFIKSRLQLETDADGKTTKIIHYFIEYQLFVNVVKYRLDQMQRRLEAGQRQSSSRATFRCVVCNITYTDLEVDRLLSLDNPGKLECVYCRSEVTEQEDHISRTDGRALIANFHRQVRDPIDAMLRECDAIHLSSALLEPEIRPLEPLQEEVEKPCVWSGAKSRESDLASERTLSNDSEVTATVTDGRVRIVLDGQPGSNTTVQPVKPRPVWMSDSTIPSGSSLGDLDRGSGTIAFQSPTLHSIDSMTVGEPFISDSMTHTLTPGRIPTNFPAASAGTKEVVEGASASANGTPSGGGDIMQLLLVHERRGLPSTHLVNKTSQFTGRSVTSKQSALSGNLSETGIANVEPGRNMEADKEKFMVQVGECLIPYSDVTPAMIKTMTAQERAEYVRIGKLAYKNIMLV